MPVLPPRVRPLHPRPKNLGSAGRTRGNLPTRRRRVRGSGSVSRGPPGPPDTSKRGTRVQRRTGRATWSCPCPLQPGPQPIGGLRFGAGGLATGAVVSGPAADSVHLSWLRQVLSQSTYANLRKASSMKAGSLQLKLGQSRLSSSPRYSNISMGFSRIAH